MNKNTFRLAAFVISGIMIVSCSQDNKVPLFNGEDLSNWTGIVFDSISNPDDVFQVKDGIILVSGEPFGYMITSESYSNYKLHVEWRWAAEPSNSGVFLHCQGMEESTWPICIEAQLKHENAGGFVLMGHGTGLNIADSTYQVPPEGKRTLGIKNLEGSSENSPGEWNVYDITCDGGDIELIVNGIVQNIASESTLKSGQIALQSEGGPVEFRNIYIELLGD
ncbi:DUF1080 domain-containing protein [Bacteroidota bacterium]